jgi:uncharacterized membrane-anchored protein YhcB (DUF1043 family)
MSAETEVTLFVGVATVLVGIATIVAVVRGPIMALRIQRKLDEEREKTNRKLSIFKTLMSYRATRLSPHFVQALNLIDIEFTDPSEKSVRDSWKELQDHYADWGRKTTAQRQVEGKALIDRSDDLLADLLVRMGGSLGYTFDRVYVKKASYYPEGLGDMEQEQHALRKGFLRLLAGEASLPVAVFQQQFAPLTSLEVVPAISTSPQEPVRNALL